MSKEKTGLAGKPTGFDYYALEHLLTVSHFNI